MTEAPRVFAREPRAPPRTRYHDENASIADAPEPPLQMEASANRELLIGQPL